MKRDVLVNLKIKLSTGCDCDYCGARPAEGIVPQYEALVCHECYEDQHGMGV
jgi:hypothetical protein